MRKCRRCGKVVADTFQECPECGNKFIVKPKQEKPKLSDDFYANNLDDINFGIDIDKEIEKIDKKKESVFKQPVKSRVERELYEEFYADSTYDEDVEHRESSNDKKVQKNRKEPNSIHKYGGDILEGKKENSARKERKQEDTTRKSSRVSKEEEKRGIQNQERKVENISILDFLKLDLRKLWMLIPVIGVIIYILVTLKKVKNPGVPKTVKNYLIYTSIIAVISVVIMTVAVVIWYQSSGLYQPYF